MENLFFDEKGTNCSYDEFGFFGSIPFEYATQVSNDNVTSILQLDENLHLQLKMTFCKQSIFVVDRTSDLRSLIIDTLLQSIKELEKTFLNDFGLFQLTKCTKFHFEASTFTPDIIAIPSFLTLTRSFPFLFTRQIILCEVSECEPTYSLYRRCRFYVDSNIAVCCIAVKYIKSGRIQISTFKKDSPEIRYSPVSITDECIFYLDKEIILQFLSREQKMKFSRLSSFIPVRFRIHPSQVKLAVLKTIQSGLFANQQNYNSNKINKNCL